MPGRIETYIHSDAITQNKGGCLIEVSCQTDFAAKEPEFVKFCKDLARWCYGFSIEKWEDIAVIPMDTGLPERKRSLEDLLGEEVKLIRVARMELGSTQRVKDESGNTSSDAGVLQG